MVQPSISKIAAHCNIKAHRAFVYSDLFPDKIHENIIYFKEANVNKTVEKKINL